MKRFLAKWCIFFGIAFAVAGYYATAVSPFTSGDLGIIGHIPFGLEYYRTIHAFEKTEGIKSQLVSVDSAAAYPILLVGDSFLEPENLLGHTMSEELGDTVRVLHDLGADNVYRPTQILLYGLTHGCFRKGQVIIAESVESTLSDRFGDISFDDTSLPDNLRQAHAWRKAQSERMVSLRDLRTRHYLLKWPAINDILTWLRIQFNHKPPFTRYTLTQPFFTHDKYADQLYVYNGVFFSCNIPQDTLDKWADTANRLTDMAERQGVTLYFMIVPDKYELYYPYIANRDSTMVPNALHFLDKVTTTRVINACDTLAPLLEQGVKDVFQLHDTHWSVMASKYMAVRTANRLKADGVLCTATPAQQ